MAKLHLVTGYAGRPHVTAADTASLFEGTIRSGEYVMAVGAKFAASAITSNTVRINDGEMIMQGRQIKLDPGSYADVTIENGTQGMKRHDLIVVRYNRDSELGVETADFVAIKGTPAASSPADPTYKTGNINSGGALQNDVPLYRVPLDGLSVGELVPLFTPQKPIFDLFKEYMAAQRLADHPVGSIYISADSTSPAQLFGGDWMQLKDVFLLAAGSKYSAGSTGGEESHKLLQSELPQTLPLPYGGNYVSGQREDVIDRSVVYLNGSADGHANIKVGEGRAINNMPPYEAVYMWKRIA